MKKSQCFLSSSISILFSRFAISLPLLPLSLSTHFAHTHICSHFHYTTLFPQMAIFKPGSRSLSEQLDRLACIASMMSPDKNLELDLEAQVSTRSVHSGSTFSTKSTQIPVSNYGALGSTEQASLLSIRPIHSAFGPRMEEPLTPDFASVHSINDTHSGLRSPQASFESLAPLLVPTRPLILRSATTVLKSVWKRTHLPVRRSFTVFHKCIAFATVGVLGTVVYFVATGRSQEMWLATVYFLCWVLGQLGFKGLPFCDA